MAKSLIEVDRAEYALDRSRSLDEATRGFFHFFRPPSSIDDREMLEDCSFLDLHIPVYVKDWPRQPSPAHPGVFEDAFPAILNQLVGGSGTLTLHLESADPHYFDELTFIRDVLVPRRIEYVLLPTRLGSQYPTEIGNLLFEWPLDSLKHIVDHWFVSPQITIEGYSSRQSCLGELAGLYFQPYDTDMMRRVLRTLEFGFKLWRDNNGVFILSDKLSEDSLRKLLMDPMDPDLEATIKEAILYSVQETGGDSHV